MYVVGGIPSVRLPALETGSDFDWGMTKVNCAGVPGLSQSINKVM